MSSSMEQEQDNSTTIPAFLRKPSEHTNSPLPSHHKSLHVFRRWRKELPVKQDQHEELGEEKEDDDDEEIARKIHALQRIVPGGESLGVDKLFDQTAGYILALQYQVKALRALTGFFDKLEKDKTKFGG